MKKFYRENLHVPHKDTEQRGSEEPTTRPLTATVLWRARKRSRKLLVPFIRSLRILQPRGCRAGRQEVEWLCIFPAGLEFPFENGSLKRRYQKIPPLNTVSELCAVYSQKKNIYKTRSCGWKCGAEQKLVETTNLNISKRKAECFDNGENTRLLIYFFTREKKRKRKH